MQSEKLDLKRHVILQIQIRLGDLVLNGFPRQGQSIPPSRNRYRAVCQPAGRVLGRNLINTYLFCNENPAKIADYFSMGGAVCGPFKNAISTIFEMSPARISVPLRPIFSFWIAFVGQSIANWNAGMNPDDSFPIRINFDATI
jgi:hypothetical protein